ncbi:hypothetical protein V8C42DRAFT_139836 [Trichoderma barbatum]
MPTMTLLKPQPMPRPRGDSISSDNVFPFYPSPRFAASSGISDSAPHSRRGSTSSICSPSSGASTDSAPPTLILALPSPPAVLSSMPLHQHDPTSSANNVTSVNSSGSFNSTNTCNIGEEPVTC